MGMYVGIKMSFPHLLLKREKPYTQPHIPCTANIVHPQASTYMVFLRKARFPQVILLVPRLITITI